MTGPRDVLPNAKREAPVSDGSLHLTWPADRVTQLAVDRDASGRIAVSFVVEPEAKAPDVPAATPGVSALVEQQRPSVEASR